MQRVMDSFFASFTTREEGKPIISYGAASFLPTGKGEVSVPVQRVLKACRKHYQTMLVNEYLTTKVHHACGHRPLLLKPQSPQTVVITHNHLTVGIREGWTARAD